MRRSGPICGAIALLASASAAEASPGPVPVTVTKVASVKAVGMTSLTVSCPRRAVSLAGSVSSMSAGVSLVGSAPTRSSRSWTFRFSAVGAAGAERPAAARALVRCVRLRLPRGVRRVTLSVSRTYAGGLRVPALGSRRVSLSCATGYLAAGYGLESSDDVHLASADPSTGGWTFRLENEGGNAVTAKLHVRCLRRSSSGRRRGGQVTHRFRMVERSFKDRVGSNAAPGLRHSCGRGSLSIGAGHRLNLADDIVLSRSYLRGTRAGAWMFDHPAGRAQRVSTTLHCLSLRTSFR